MSSTPIIGDIYEHYKKKTYKIIGIARHSETLEEMIVYQAQYDCPTFGKNQVWVRPRSLFFETVEIKNIRVPRFKRIEATHKEK